MSVVTRLWADNPVLVKELRVRMRGARAYWILSGYLAFLALILFVQYSAWWNTVQAGGGGISAGSKIGQSFFYAIVWTQLALVALITPAVTSGAITVEKEQRTMEMLEMTQLPRSHIVAGKLLSAVGFVALLVISSLPLTSICFFLGGVSPEQVFYWYLILLATSFVTASIGLVWSTVARTTAAAVLFTYASLSFPFVVFLAAGMYSSTSAFMGGGASYNPLLTMSLIMGLFGVYVPDMFIGSTPLAPILKAWDFKRYFGVPVWSWIVPATTYGLIGLTLAAVATARLETFPERHAGKLRLLVVLLLLQQMFFFFGARFTIYTGSPAGASSVTAGQFPLLFMLAYPVLILTLLVPIFATGEIRRAEARAFSSYLASGWSPRALGTGRLSSGLPFLILLSLLIVGAYCLSYVAVGRPAGILRGMPAAIGAPAPTAPNQPVPSMGAPAGINREQDHGPQLLRIWLAVAASLVGLSSLGLLFSAMVRNRWTAMALLYLVIIGVFAAPAIAKADFDAGGRTGSPSALINLYYLNPIMAIVEASDISGGFRTGTALMFGAAPMAAVTTVSYLFLAGVALLLTLPFVNRIAVGPVLPYDEMAARV